MHVRVTACNGKGLDRLELPAATRRRFLFACETGIYFIPSDSTSSSSLCSFPSEKLQTLFFHTLPMQRSQGPSGKLTAGLRPEMLVIQVHVDLLLWVAEGQVDLKAVLVWARPILSAGQILNKSRWGAVVMDNSSC